MANKSCEIRLEGFPALYKIAGNVFLQSSKPIDCEPFQALSSNQKIGGSFFCNGTTPTPSSTPKPAQSSSSSPGSGLSAGAKGGVAAGAVVFGIIILVGGTIAAIKRRKRRRVEKWSEAQRLAEKVEESEKLRLELAASQPVEAGNSHEMAGDVEQRGKTYQPHAQELPS